MLQFFVRSTGRLIRPIQSASLHTSPLRYSDTVFQTKKLERTYHPRGYENSAGYRRARKPYLLRNTIAFLLLSSFIGGVYAYSIMMVEQDDFSDLESFRVHPTEESVPTTIQDTITEPSKELVYDRLSDLNVSEPSKSLWERLTYFLGLGAKKTGKGTASPDPTSGPVMNKKVI